MLVGRCLMRTTRIISRTPRGLPRVTRSPGAGLCTHWYSPGAPPVPSVGAMPRQRDMASPQPPQVVGQELVVDHPGPLDRAVDPADQPQGVGHAVELFFDEFASAPQFGRLELVDRFV